jgi:hypothetical protein
MPHLTTRTLTNTAEGPLQYPNGLVVAENTELWFELVDANHEPCYAIDATTGEVVLSPAVCYTYQGIFQIGLWPNDRGTTSMYRMSAPSIPEFGYIYSYIPSGTTAMTFSEFMALADNGTTWTALPGYLVPVGGNTGEVLAKKSSANGDLIWQIGGSGGGGSVVVSLTEPLNPTEGMIWVIQ